ncbi:spidroin-2-like [Topomyia yanbarensis]|uniref:spidroin-2-like n=1 Tax=Topomyia yanbarensis TaxID=2498891 RepID=UPI00273BDD62|nr:spidroin-2-like [Topomyia yanbarensis]
MTGFAPEDWRFPVSKRPSCKPKAGGPACRPSNPVNSPPQALPQQLVSSGIAPPQKCTSGRILQAQCHQYSGQQPINAGVARYPSLSNPGQGYAPQQPYLQQPGGTWHPPPHYGPGSSPVQMCVDGNRQVPCQQLPGQRPPGNRIPAQQFPGVQFPGQQFPGQQFSGQPLPGQQYAGQRLPGQRLPGQQLPGQQFPGQQLPGQRLPGQQLPGQQLPGQQLPGQQLPGQQYTGQQYTGQQFPVQYFPGQQFQPIPGQPPSRQFPGLQPPANIGVDPWAVAKNKTDIGLSKAKLRQGKQGEPSSGVRKGLAIGVLLLTHAVYLLM